MQKVTKRTLHCKKSSTWGRCKKTFEIFRKFLILETSQTFQLILVDFTELVSGKVLIPLFKGSQRLAALKASCSES